MKRIITLLVALSVLACFIMPELSLSKQGKHAGEQKMLDVDIQFSDARGKTVTNADGIFYHMGRHVVKEAKVYPSQYWGEFPLYYVNSTVGVTVKVTNKGPRAKAKIRIKTESYTLRTDGSSGDALCEPIIIDEEIAKGETKTIDASFFIHYVPNMESGLDRFLVKVLHQNEGGGPGNKEPGLIMVKEGVFCPPEYEK